MLWYPAGTAFVLEFTEELTLWGIDTDCIMSGLREVDYRSLAKKSGDVNRLS